MGSNIDAVQESLNNELRKVGYTPILVHLTKDIKEIIPELKSRSTTTYEDKISLMNEVVSLSGREDFLATVAVASIVSRRIFLNLNRGLSQRHSQEFQAPRTAYIIRQLKRKQEVTTLQKIYGKKFVQISVAVGEEEQCQAVLSIIGREHPNFLIRKRQRSKKIIERDREESGVDFGQGTINIHHSGDVFVAGNANQLSKQ